MPKVCLDQQTDGSINAGVKVLDDLVDFLILKYFFSLRIMKYSFFNTGIMPF